MSDSSAAIVNDGLATVNFLAISLGKIREKNYNALEYTFASLERAAEFLDKISNFAVLVQLSIPQLEQLDYVVSAIQHFATQIIVTASANIDPNDPEAMEKLSKLQFLAIAVIEKAATAKAMIATTIFAKKVGKENELLEGKLGWFEPSPIIERDIIDKAMKEYERGDFKNP